MCKSLTPTWMDCLICSSHISTFFNSFNGSKKIENNTATPTFWICNTCRPRRIRSFSIKLICSPIRASRVIRMTLLGTTQWGQKAWCESGTRPFKLITPANHRSTSSIKIIMSFSLDWRRSITAMPIKCSNDHLAKAATSWFNFPRLRKIVQKVNLNLSWHYRMKDDIRGGKSIRRRLIWGIRRYWILTWTL